VFRQGTELILVNVVVRDRRGEVVRGLTKDDFSILEDNKPQTITNFDFEDLTGPTTPGSAAAEPPSSVILGTLRQAGVPTARGVRGGVEAGVPTARGVRGGVEAGVPTARGVRGGAEPVPQPLPASPIDIHGRRLLVLFFDLSSMQPEEIQRAIDAARAYVDKRVSTADLIAIVSLATALRVDQDFTSDRELLLKALGRFGRAGANGFEAGAAGDPEGTPDDSTAFTPDDTEFNIFNTDRRLDALRSLSDALSPIEQKKSVVYFSSGMSQSGSDNQVQLRRTVDRAVRANVSIYAADVRGLQAIVPGGQASQASARGRAPFSGASVTDQFGGLASSQDTLTTLAEDTGGRAFFDSNAFGSIFTRVVEDTSAYYLLGFSSTNPARDGRFRRITVRVNRPDVKLEYRSGYYASRDFAHSTRDDRERQLQDQLESDLSATDLSTYVSAAYFRVGDSRYFVPISIVLPGNQLPLTSVSEANKATIDVLGIVRNEQRRPVARIRDTIRLAIDSIEDLKRKTVQYETSFELPPGRYRVKVVVRENTSGTTGSYEAGLVVPDLARDTIKLSSIVVGTQLKAGARRADRNPLVRDGRELVPNVTHVVSTAQHLYFYYEIYDPGRTADASRRIKVMTSLAFYRGRQRAFETPLVQTTELSAPDRTAAAFQLDVPAASLKPGLYTCQVNVVDDVAGTFAFPRLQLYVRK
jgi:VWFA-related protein